jgi:hypothetical protein
MPGIIQIDKVLYAVIQTVYSDGHSERIVIAYRTARSLRESIAPERIIAGGFHSRNEAAEFAQHTKTYSKLRCRISRRLREGRRSLRHVASTVATIFSTPSTAVC